MLPKYLPPSLASIRLSILMQMWFEDFQDAPRLASPPLPPPPPPPTHCGYPGYRNWMIFRGGNDNSTKTLKMSIPPTLPPQKYHISKACVMIRNIYFSKNQQNCWIQLISRKFSPLDFSNSESPFPLNASHQVSAQSDLRFRAETEQNEFSNLHVTPTPPTKSHLGFGSRCGLKIFKKATSDSESPFSPNASHQVSAQSDLQLRRRCRKCEKLMMEGKQTTGHGVSWSVAKLQVS